MLRYLIEKEFKQLKRNSFLPRLILLFPCMMMLVMPWAATLEIENLRMVYLKGSGICDIGFQLSVLSSFALLLYAWAIRSYRKQQ